VGVMPPGFGLPSRCELWLPLGWMGVSLTERRSAHWHNVIARLKPGVTLEQARSELNLIQARIRQAHPGETIGSEVAVVPLLHQAVGRNMRTALLVLGAGRWRVMQQLIIESLVLAVLGGGLGALFGGWGLQLFIAASPGNIPRL